MPSSCSRAAHRRAASIKSKPSVILRLLQRSFVTALHPRARRPRSARGQESLVGKYDDKTNSFGTGQSAGVQLYSIAAGAIAASQVARDAAAPPELKLHADATAKAAGREPSNDNVLRGFGSYGGEEHVWYVLTAEAKATLGGGEWAAFRKSIRARLAAIQREDGTCAATTASPAPASAPPRR